VKRPKPTPEQPQHLCLEKGYAGEPVDRQVRKRGYTSHVPCKTNQLPKRHGKARRRKIERTHSWLNRARRLPIRWDKKVVNYLGFLHLQFAIVALRTRSFSDRL
jgi:putative transposase